MPLEDRQLAAISKLAWQDLERIEIQALRAELLDLAWRELRFPPPVGSGIEGYLPNNPLYSVRHAVRRADVSFTVERPLYLDLGDDERDARSRVRTLARRYYIIYRRVRPGDARQLGQAGGKRADLIVCRFFDQEKMGPYVDRLFSA